MSFGRREFGGRENRTPPPLMDPTRKRDSGRILALFRPYRTRLAAVLVLIVFTAGVGILNPVLLRDAVDKGIFHHDTTLLTILVAAMLAGAIFTNAAGVWPTCRSNVVGQRLM